MNGCAPGLALIERLKAIRKWVNVLFNSLESANLKEGSKNSYPRREQRHFVLSRQFDSLDVSEFKGQIGYRLLAVLE